MVIKPKIRNNICLTAHPVGCAAQVNEQIGYVKKMGSFTGSRSVLIIGASNGYGLASRIVSAFACSAPTLGVSYEKPGSNRRTGTAGWHNNTAFEKAVYEAGIPAWSINGDAFSDAVKQEACARARGNMGKVDLVIYSIASPRRLDPVTGELYSTVIKPIGGSFTAKTVDFESGTVINTTAEPATDDEIRATVKVMGGEDWELWIRMLMEHNILAENVTTIAFSYIGPKITAPIYRDGTIGRAKKHLEETARRLDRLLSVTGGRALISVNKALVTRASAVIPAVPLYIALLYRVMKKKGIHEGCIEQMYRLFRDFLYTDNHPILDEDGRIRLDDKELREDIQNEVVDLWRRVSSANIEELSDIQGFRDEFLRHHGFGMPGVDYTADIEF
jgi:enoyl-[acyl-carrier protein] reductase/trans-2-enoyl-CoA reductase (NAD+)